MSYFRMRLPPTFVLREGILNIRQSKSTKRKRKNENGIAKAHEGCRTGGHYEGNEGEREDDAKMAESELD
jgi:hypothetical protein